MATYRRKKLGRDMASRTRQDWSTCSACGKRSYQNKSSAREALRHLRHHSKINDGSAVTLGIYPCDVTGYWHVGHSGVQRANLNDPRLTFLDEPTTNGSTDVRKADPAGSRPPRRRSEAGSPDVSVEGEHRPEEL